LHVSAINHHPQGDIRTNEHTILVHQIYMHSVENIQNITYKYNNMEINIILYL